MTATPMLGGIGRATRRALIAPFALLACAASAGAQAPAVTDAPRPVLRKPTAAEDLMMFSQVLNQIRVNHPDSVDSHQLFLAAVDGLVRATDPHSYVIPASRLSPEREKAWREGQLWPVPITFYFIGGAPVVASVPPTLAGTLDVLPGDELVAVDGRPVSAESADELSIAMAGPKQSVVTLSLERVRPDGSVARLERAVKRQRVTDESAVAAATLLDAAGTGYVRITTFESAKAAEELHDALARLEKRGMKRLVLDLRDNGGGLVDEATVVASEFLPRGAVVYTAVGRKPDVNRQGKVERSFFGSERRYPVVVMINGGTASAAEMVAGALQDHDRALVVGRPSFGKSLLMRGFPLSDGSALMLTVGHVKTPCGRVIQREYRGVTRREYYRLARADRDTAGRPTCRTPRGRTLYGGGGIYPDVLLADAPLAPLWLARLREQDVLLKWAGGWVAQSGSALGTLDAFAAGPKLPAADVAAFRAFAASQGTPVPDDAEALAAVERPLALAVARAKWGLEGWARTAAALDADVRAAAATFDRAEALLK